MKGSENGAGGSPVLREKVVSEFIENPLFKSLRNQLGDHSEMSKFAKKFSNDTNLEDLDQIFSHL